MRLLDANVDVHLVEVLLELGVSCETAANRGWKALSNGELVSVAVGAGFTCLLTRDQLFGESAARALKTFPTFAVVVLDLPQQRWQAYQEQFLAAWREQPIGPLAGSLVHWPKK
jgi:hypothetical protein